MLNIRSRESIVLASKSEIRAAMLSYLSIPNEIMPANIDEVAIRGEAGDQPLDAQALLLAAAKAGSVSQILPESLVIGSDQICSIEGEILSKPGTTENAIRQLHKLRGKTHQQTSAVAVYKAGEKLWDAVDVARLTMRPLTDEEITLYVEADEPIHSCGAYKFESYGVHLFSKVEGDADTVYGMPMMPLLAWLHEQNVLYLSAD